MTDEFPVHEELETINGRTIFKSDDWWKAVLLYESHSGRRIGIYLWKQTGDRWKRKQKYVIRSVDDWNKDREAIQGFLGELSENNHRQDMSEESTDDGSDNIFALVETELGALLEDEDVSEERIQGYADALDRVHAAQGGQKPWHYLSTVSSNEIEEHRKRAKEYLTMRDR